VAALQQEFQDGAREFGLSVVTLTTKQA